jgi:hypothetical protein
MPPAIIEDELRRWNRVIWRKFVLDNLLSLPMDMICCGLSDVGKAQRFVSVHLFDQTLQRLMHGYCEIVKSTESIMSAMRSLQGQVCVLSARVESLVARYLDPITLNKLTPPPAMTIAKEPSPVFQQHKFTWPSSWAKKKVSELIVFYLSYDLANALTSLTERTRVQRELVRIIGIARHFVAFASVPSFPADGDVDNQRNWLNAIQVPAEYAEVQLLDILDQSKSESAKRKRRSTGCVLRMWSQLQENDLSSIRLFFV